MRAISGRRGADGAGIRARLGLGDRHRRPTPGVFRPLLRRAYRGDSGIAEPLSRQCEQQPDIAATQFHRAQDGREIGVAGRPAVASRAFGAATACRAGPQATGLGCGLQQVGDEVEFLGPGVFGTVIAPREPKNLVGDGRRGIECRADAGRDFEGDHGRFTP